MGEAMNERLAWRGRSALLACAMGALLAGAPVDAADGNADRPGGTGARLTDLAACDDRAPQDRDNCRREAAAAREDARRGQLGNGSAQQYEANALARCERLPAEERRACVARMQGQGTARGSAAEGGIYRELVIREDAPPQDGTKR